MKITVIHHNISRRVAIRHRQVLIEYDFQAGIASQVAFHLYRPINWTVDDVAAWIEQDVNLLVHIHKDFISLVLAYGDSWCGGGYGVGAEETEWAELFYIQDGGLWLDYLWGDKGLYVGCVGELRVAEIDDLVQDLVD